MGKELYDQVTDYLKSLGYYAEDGVWVLEDSNNIGFVVTYTEIDVGFMVYQTACLYESGFFLFLGSFVTAKAFINNIHHLNRGID